MYRKEGLKANVIKTLFTTNPMLSGFLTQKDPIVDRTISGHQNSTELKQKGLK